MKPWIELTHLAGFDWASDHPDVVSKKASRAQDLVGSEDRQAGCLEHGRRAASGRSGLEAAQA
jgi:hypothetical protein